MDVSVIIPVYKGQKYIAPVLKMLTENVRYAEEHGNPLEIEILFVNDYPDEDIVIDQQIDDFEITLITNKVNSGIHQTRVNGLKRAKGEYILFLDQDDEITPDCLYSQILSICDNDIVVGNGYRYIDGNYRKIYRNTGKQKLACKAGIYLRAANQIISPGQCLIRKTAIPSAWCENIMKDNGGDDLFLWLLMFENGSHFCINTACIYKHIDTGINLSGDLGAMYKSSDNLIKIAEEAKLLNTTSIALYKRRIRYLKSMHNASLLNKILISIKNADICIAKIYAFYR